MRYDSDSGHFVPTEKRKQNPVVVGSKVDTDNHRILQEMLADANGVTEGTTQRLPDKDVNRYSWRTQGLPWSAEGKGLMQEIGSRWSSSCQPT